jgi:hypothetical protein
MSDYSTDILREGLGILASIIAEDIIAKRMAVAPVKSVQQGEDHGNVQDK